MANTDGGRMTPPYTGPASGIIPIFEFDANEPLVEAGVITVDETCCTLTFRIDDKEPASDVTGHLHGTGSWLGDGLPLTRKTGYWEALACVPINTTATYWYQFEWTMPEVNGAIRSSAWEASFEEADGNRRNFVQLGASCSTAPDAAVVLPFDAGAPDAP